MTFEVGGDCGLTGRSTPRRAPYLKRPKRPKPSMRNLLELRVAAQGLDDQPSDGEPAFPRCQGNCLVTPQFHPAAHLE